MNNNKMQLIITITIAVILILLLTIVLTIKNSYKINSTIPDENIPEEIKSINEKYEYNQFYYQRITTSSLMNIYFNDYINTTLQQSEKAYNLLEEEYKKKRFPKYEDYKNYIDVNREYYKNAKLNKYYEIKYDDYTQYIMNDQYGNYYIFNVTAVLRYTVLLDSYSSPIKDTIDKYNNANEIEKSGMHVQTFIEMLNTKDYTSAYNVLAQGFKENYFKDEATFKKFAQSAFFKNNKIKSVSGEKKDNYYVVEVTIQNYDDLTKELKPINFIVNIKDNMEFELSFGSK